MICYVTHAIDLVVMKIRLSLHYQKNVLRYKFFIVKVLVKIRKVRIVRFGLFVFSFPGILNINSLMVDHGSTTKVGSKNKMVYLCLHKYDHMDKDINQSLLELILPEGILEYFTTVGFDYKYAL